MFIIEDILEAISTCIILNNGSKHVFTSASVDSRNISGGELFFALKTELNDGHKYISQAIAKGAHGIVVTEECDHFSFPDVYIIKVQDAIQALLDLSKFIRMKYNPKVIAVTGSVGKTSIKDMTHHILSRYYPAQKNDASYNNEIGVPLTLLKLEKDSTHLITEIGANHVGEVDKLSSIVKPDIAIISKIGYAHIGNFGSIQNTLKAKTEIISQISQGGYLIVNGDDSLLIDYVNKVDDDIKIITVGIGNKSDLYVDNLEMDDQGISGEIFYRGEKCFFHINMIGFHNIYTMLFAVSVSVINNISLANACELLKLYRPVNNRLFLNKVNDDLWLINDYYNSSPDAAISAIKTLKSLHRETSIAVLGDMKELGEYSKYCHELVGNEIDKSVDYVVLIGREVEAIRKVCIDKGFVNNVNVFRFDNVHEAIKIIHGLIDSQNSFKTILIKGSRFMHLERIAMSLNCQGLKCYKADCSKYVNCKDCDEYAI